MSKNKNLLYFFWIITSVLLVIFVPKDKIRQGVAGFLFKQLFTWLFGLVVVEKGLIEYPVRIFKKANKSSFTFEYFIYPSVCAIFNLHYPETKGRWWRLGYQVMFAGFISGLEFILEKKTDLIKYKKWAWYWSFLSIFITDHLSRMCYRWFFKGFVPRDPVQQ